MLAVITGIMGWSLNMAHRTLAKGEKKIHDLERTKVSLSLIESQIRSLFPYQFSDEDGQRKLYFTGAKDKLMFASNYSLWHGIRGNTFVTYDVQTNEQGKQHLKITEQMIGLEEQDEEVLLDNCTSIHYEYFLKNALEEGKWIEEWPAEEHGLPGKIKIHMQCDAKQLALLVEPLVKKTDLLSSTAIPK